MEIKRVVVGDLEENCYILEIDDEALVIDPGDEINKIKEIIGNKKVIGVLVTHNHFDHVGVLHHFDKNIIYDYSNLEEKECAIGKFTFSVIYTPGHTSDSISYYFKENNCLLCGDFIFKDSIGRWDFPTGNFNEMKKSIDKIKKYPKDMVIYPGHGEYTTLDYEIKNNRYFDL